MRVTVCTGFLVSFLVGLATPSPAAVETVHFDGVVTYVRLSLEEPVPPWQFVIEGETPFSGSFVYDDARPDLDVDPGHGDYPFEGAPFRLRVEIGPYGYETTRFGIDVRNDMPSFPGGFDGQLVAARHVAGTGAIPCCLAPFADSLLVIFGSGPEADAIESDAMIPGSALLETLPFGSLWLSTCRWDSLPFPSCQPSVEVSGRVEHVRVVPEAGSATTGMAATSAIIVLVARARGRPRSTPQPGSSRRK